MMLSSIKEILMWVVYMLGCRRSLLSILSRCLFPEQCYSVCFRYVLLDFSYYLIMLKVDLHSWPLFSSRVGHHVEDRGP